MTRSAKHSRLVLGRRGAAHLKLMPIFAIAFGLAIPRSKQEGLRAASRLGGPYCRGGHVLVSMSKLLAQEQIARSDLDQIIEKRGIDNSACVRLTGIYHNLIRYWAEP